MNGGMDFNEFREWAFAFVTKWIFVLSWAFISLIGKLSTMLLLDKKITWKQVIGSAGVTLFFGAMSIEVSDYFHLKKVTEMVFVPAICFLSDKMAIALFQLNLNEILTVITDLSDYIKRKRS
jgi:hypothetical protein